MKTKFLRDSVSAATFVTVSADGSIAQVGCIWKRLSTHPRPSCDNKPWALAGSSSFKCSHQEMWRKGSSILVASSSLRAVSISQSWKWLVSCFGTCWEPHLLKLKIALRDVRVEWNPLEPEDNSQSYRLGELGKVFLGGGEGGFLVCLKCFSHRRWFGWIWGRF